MGSHRPLIFAYHAIDRLTYDPNGTATSPERFRSQMLYLKRRNLRGVSMRELRRAIERGDSSRGLVGLTFDDGYSDFLHTALPVLEELGFSATVFVIAGMLGGENIWEHVYESQSRLRLLTADELLEVTERGMEVGSHSMSHPRLPSLEPGRVDEELSESRRILGEILGEAVDGFSYPYGDTSEAVIKAVGRAGYSYACAWNERDEWYQHHMPRIPIFEKDNAFRFAAKVRIYWPYRSLISKLGRRDA